MTSEPDTTADIGPYAEFPIVILDEDGVVDRVATEDEARAYCAEQPGTRWAYEAA